MAVDPEVMAAFGLTTGQAVSDFLVTKIMEAEVAMLKAEIQAEKAMSGPTETI